jgi:hypothetical protein
LAIDLDHEAATALARLTDADDGFGQLIESLRGWLFDGASLGSFGLYSASHDAFAFSALGADCQRT